MKRNLSLVLVSAFLILSILHLLVYAAVQQVHRQAANDGPRLLSGLLLEKAAAGNAFDTLDAASRAVVSAQGLYYVVADGTGAIKGSNLPAYDGAVSRIPQGLIKETIRRGQHAITWAPQGVRYALVLRRVPGRNLFVGACKPLMYTEANVLRLWQMVLISWIGCSLSLAFAGSVLFRRFSLLPARQQLPQAA